MTIKKSYARSHVSTVLVFGPELVSYERSRRETAAKFHHFSARIFFVKISNSQDSMIYAILSFSGYIFPKWVLSQMFQSPDPAARPSVRPSCTTGYQTGSCSSISQFTGYRNGSCSSISQFTSYQNGSCSSISQFKTESKWVVFQYFSVHKLSTWLIFQYFQNPRLQIQAKIK